MKRKLKLTEEVVCKLSTPRNIIGGLSTDVCNLEPYTSRNTACKDTFYSECLCLSDMNCDPLSQACPSEPISNGCGDATNHCSYTCQTVDYTNCIINL